MKSGGFLGASVVAAFVASLCCILPVILGIAGVSALGAAAAFGIWRPYLLVISFALLGTGMYFAYRPAQQHCQPGASCVRHTMGRSGRVALWIVTALVTFFAAFPYFSGPIAERLLSTRTKGAIVVASASATIERVILTVEGMDCPACASTIEKQLKAIPGISRASVSYEQHKAEVEYDPSVISLKQIEAAIRERGYRVQRAS